MNTSTPLNFLDALKAIQEGRSLAQAAGLSRDLLRVLYASAVGLYESGQHEEALMQLHQLTSLDARNPDPWALTGNCFLKMGRFAEAVTAWRVAMAAAPTFATAATIVRTAVAIKDPEASAEALMVARRQRTTPNQFADYEALLDLWNRHFAPALVS
jgi:Flp pilus assembly protein TadD